MPPCVHPVVYTLGIPPCVHTPGTPTTHPGYTYYTPRVHLLHPGRHIYRVIPTQGGIYTHPGRHIGRVTLREAPGSLINGVLRSGRLPGASLTVFYAQRGSREPLLTCFTRREALGSLFYRYSWSWEALGSLFYSYSWSWEALGSLFLLLFPSWEARGSLFLVNSRLGRPSEASLSLISQDRW